MSPGAFAVLIGTLAGLGSAILLIYTFARFSCFACGYWSARKTCPKCGNVRA